MYKRQAVEHSLGKGEVSGSSPDEGIPRDISTTTISKNLAKRDIIQIYPDIALIYAIHSNFCSNSLIISDYKFIYSFLINKKLCGSWL